MCVSWVKLVCVCGGGGGGGGGGKRALLYAEPDALCSVYLSKCSLAVFKLVDLLIFLLRSSIDLLLLAYFLENCTLDIVP